MGAAAGRDGVAEGAEVVDGCGGWETEEGAGSGPVGPVNEGVRICGVAPVALGLKSTGGAREGPGAEGVGAPDWSGAGEGNGLGAVIVPNAAGAAAAVGIGGVWL